MPEHEKIPFTEGGAVNVLIDRDSKNRRILVVNSGKFWDPDIVSSDSLFKMFYLSMYIFFKIIPLLSCTFNELL